MLSFENGYMWFQIDSGLSEEVSIAAAACGIQRDELFPDVRPADQRFGDFQANGVMPYAKSKKSNPRQISEKIVAELKKKEVFQKKISVSIAGAGFINFKLSDEFLAEWLNIYKSISTFQKELPCQLIGKKVVIDYSSPNTAKQMHVGHLRSMNIGNSIYRILKFCGVNVVSDNHIGDWGTQFGILIMAIKRVKADISKLSLEGIESLYKQGVELSKNDDSALSEARRELVKLQNGDVENTKIWKTINDVSQRSFDEIYKLADVSFDYTLGESFYNDKIDRVCSELVKSGIAEESNGALCVFHREHERFSKQPFIIRKSDGASNYATTDLATVLYRTEELGADEIIYVTDGRQQDHFQQLFLTVKKWYSAYGRKCPVLKHVWFGTVLGKDNKAIKTRSGTSIKLKDLFSEAVDRALKIISEKSTALSNDERFEVAEILGVDSVKYADLASNRTSDYVFSWDKMLSFDGNTAAYLLYAITRMMSILHKCNTNFDEIKVYTIGTVDERNLVRKLMYFPIILSQTISDLRPHYLCTYLFELAGEYSTFYNSNRVIGEKSNIFERRLVLILRTLAVMEAGMDLLDLKTLEKM